jgi:hypothetical protein
MANSHSTATPEATKTSAIAHPPVPDVQKASEPEIDRSEMLGARAIQAIGGRSPETSPEQYAGSLGQLSRRSQTGMLRQLQRSYGNSYVGSVIQRKADGNGTCTECEKKEKEIQRKGEGDVSAVPDGFEATMQRSGMGQPLDDGTRSFMESRFGEDFGEVKVHTDSAAAEASQQIQAQAFTTGRNIYFGQGRFQPQVTEGKKLLAHELTHVVQQNNVSSTPIMAKPILGSSGDVFEKEADAVANQLISGNSVGSDATGSVTTDTQSLISRQNSTDSSINLIQRQDTNADGGGGATSATAPATIPGSSGLNSSSPSHAVLADRKFIDDALKSKDVEDVKHIRNFGLASEEEKFTLIGILLDQTWVGPYDEYALEAIWGSFGDRLIKVASAHLELWNNCIERGAELNDLPAVKKLEGQFQADVRTIVTGYLFQNRQFVTTEMDRLGIPADEKTNVPTPTLDQTEEVRKMQVAATEVAKLQKAQEESRNIIVGFEPNPHRFEPNLWGNDPNVPKQSDDSPNFIPTFFNPYAEKPPLDSNPDDRLPTALGLPSSNVTVTSYIKVKDAYDAATKSITDYLHFYPALYAISREGKSATTSTFAGTDSPVQAREQIGIAMRKLFHDIGETQKKLDEEKLDPLDLTPIHDQVLFGGMKGSSGTDWKDFLPNSVATALVKKHEFTKVLIDLGLQTAAAALFMLAPLTGGASLYVMLAGLAVSGFKLNISTQQYEAVSLAAKTSAVPGTELVTPGHVDESKMAMEADQVAFTLAALAVGTAAAIKLFAAIKGSIPKPPTGTPFSKALEAPAEVTRRPFLSVDRIRSMRARGVRVMTFRTPDADVVQNQVIKPQGKTNPNFGDRISLVQGFRGAPYGNYCLVIEETSLNNNFYPHTASPGEFFTTSEIPTDAGYWTTIEIVEEALKR